MYNPQLKSFQHMQPSTLPRDLQVSKALHSWRHVKATLQKLLQHLQAVLPYEVDSALHPPHGTCPTVAKLRPLMM